MYTRLRAAGWLLWIIPLGEVALLVWAIWQRTPDVPMVDEWFYIHQLREWDQGTLTLGSLMSFHNEHRIFVPRLISLPLILATGWNRQLAMMVSLAVALAGAGLLYACLRRSTPTLARQPAVVALLAALYFSPAPAYNYLMPFQIAFFTTVSGVALTAWALCGPLTTRALLMAGLGALIASLSIAGGLMVWPAFLLVLLGRVPDRWTYWLPWSLCGAAVMAWYFSETPTGGTVPPHVFDPLRNLAFSLTYLGGPFAYPFPTQAMIFGVLGMLLAGVNLTLVWRARRSFEMVWPWIGLGAFVGLSAVATSYGRVFGGLDLALSPYRQTFSLLAWVAAGVITFVALESPTLRAVSRPWRIGAVAFNLVIWAASAVAIVPAASRAFETANFAQHVREQSCIIHWARCPPEIRLIYTYGSPADPDYLRARHLSIFRHPAKRTRGSE